MVKRKSLKIAFCTILIILLSWMAHPSYGQCETGDCSGGKCVVPQFQPKPIFDYSGWRASIAPLKDVAQTSKAWRYERRIGHFKSVVRVRGETRGSARYFGSGCVIRWGGRVVILTAGHVLRKVTNVFIRGRTRYQRCRVLKTNDTWDLAILEPTDLSDLDPAQLAYSEDGILKVGDRLESCGFGSDDKLAVNSGVLRSFSMPKGNPVPDCFMLSGYVRQGDSGGPIFRNKKLVGVLWGGADKMVHGTQLGRLHVFLTSTLGPERSISQKRSLIGINTEMFNCNQRRPTRPQTRPPTQAPTRPAQINVQADPRIGNALVSIDGKLDLVVQNTNPAASQVDQIEEEKSSKTNPFLTVAVLAVSVIGGFLIYFSKGT